MAENEIIADGKTKRLFKSVNGCVLIENKDDITKDDDPSKTRTVANKATYATSTTCAVFALLGQAGIPTAFKGQVAGNKFLALECKMIPLEVIIRRYAVGSYLKRYPNLEKPKGEVPHRFHRLVFEMFLKTTDSVVNLKSGPVKIGNDDNKVDDPFISNPYDGVWELKYPKIPSWDDKSKIAQTIFQDEVLPHSVSVAKIEELARKTFLILEKEWAKLGHRLIDFKIEFGIDQYGNLLVADVVDNDSWRLRTSDWKELSKQNFRDNLDMIEVIDKYAIVANLVQRFYVPEQAIICWRGSKSDPPIECDWINGVYIEDITLTTPDGMWVNGIHVEDVVLSGHKGTKKALNKLEEILAKYPSGGIIITVVGMSNGLGPILAAHTNWLVISVPVSHKERPHDVWSSLEAPSGVPLATILSPKNAVLAARNILSISNPVVYMQRQYEIEELDE